MQTSLLKMSLYLKSLLCLESYFLDFYFILFFM